MPDVDFPSFWDPSVIEMTQDESLIDSLVEYEAELLSAWDEFEKVLKKYTNVFPEKFCNKDLFFNVFG
jgi:hypothetical protein